VELTIAVDADTPLSRAVASGAPSAAVSAAIPRDEDSVLCYLTVAAADAGSLVAAARDTDGIERVEPVGDGDAVRLQVITAGPVPSTVVAEQGGVVVDATIEGGETTLTVRVPKRRTFRPVLDGIGRQFDEPRVSAFTTAPADTTETDPLSALTARQRDVLRAARNAGYFKQPRTQSATEVADSLGVSRQTFDQVLRAAQRNLLTAVLDGN
jgi:predicted DNA binding protein